MSRRTISDVLASAQSRLDRVTPAEAWRRSRDGWLIVDTRSSDDRRARGVIPGSVHAPLSVLEWRVDPASGHQDPAIAGHEDRLILVCADGYSSSLAAIGAPMTALIVSHAVWDIWIFLVSPTERE